MNKSRESGIELLRLILIFFILLMHGIVVADKGTVMVVSALGNAGVSCFMLCSGFFSIKRSMVKFIKLEMTLIFTSYLTLIASIIMGAKPTCLEEVGRFLLPTIASYSWFVTAYVVIFLFSPYINLACEKLEKSAFKRFLFLSLLVFSIVPTVFMYDFMGQGGKNVIHLCIMYLVGRYLALHGDWFEHISTKNYLLFYGLSIIAELGLNYGASLIFDGFSNHFARDLSIIVIMQAVALFYIFKRIKLKSVLMNRLASNVLAIILLEQFSRLIIYKYVPIEMVEDSCGVVFSTVTVCVLEIIVGIIINELRVLLFSGFENWLGNKLSEVLSYKQLI